MSQGLNFTPEEEAEFKELTTLKPRNMGERMSIRADKIANNIWMFLFLALFCLVSYTILQRILNQMLFLSNSYQLVALPILGTATALSTMLILRFLFRVLLEVRKLVKEFRDEAKRRDEQRTKELEAIRQEQLELRTMHEEKRESDLRRDAMLERILEGVENHGTNHRT